MSEFETLRALEVFGVVLLAVVLWLWGWVFCRSLAGMRSGGGRRTPERSEAYVRHMAELKRRQRKYTICGWCGKKWDKETGEVYERQPGWAPLMQSTGICEPCKRRVIAEAEREVGTR